MITVGQMRAFTNAQKPRGRGMGAVIYTGSGTGADQATGLPVTVDDSVGGLTPGQVVDPSLVVGGAGGSIASSGNNAFNTVAADVGTAANLGLTLARAAGVLPRLPAAPPPSAPWTTTQKLGAGLALAGATGLAAWGLGLVGGKKKRRRRG